MYGADVDQLDRLSRAMDRAGEELLSHIRRLSSAYQRDIWRGPDAGRARSDWDSGLSVQVRSVATALTECAAVLRRNAQEQRDASSAQTGSLGGHDGPGRLPGSAGAKEDTRGYADREGDIRRGKYGRDRDMLDLSVAAYWDKKNGGFGTPPKGWDEVSGDELRKIGVNPDLLGEYGSSFSARVYRDVEGNYAVAYEGTDMWNGKDWAENIGGARWVADSDARAIRVARAMQAALDGTGASLEFTGHSAGGRQAILAGQVTGGRVVTFNTAPVSAVQQGVAIAGGGFATPEITNYVTPTDPLRVGRIDPTTRPPGTYVVIEPLKRYSGVNLWDKGTWGHSTEALKQGFERKVAGEGEYY